MDSIPVLSNLVGEVHHERLNGCGRQRSNVGGTVNLIDIPDSELCGKWAGDAKPNGNHTVEGAGGPRSPAARVGASRKTPHGNEGTSAGRDLPPPREAWSR